MYGEADLTITLKLVPAANRLQLSRLIDKSKGPGMTPAKKKKKATMGRPPLPKGEAKGAMFAVRLKPSELAVITAAAGADGRTISEWIREAIRKATPKTERS